MDWNEDGKKDLVVGERNGYIRIYLNVNTDEDPVFNGYTFLEIQGTKYDCGYTAFPAITDWNNDGMKDVLCGEDGGRVYLLLNRGTNANPQFTGSVPLKMNGADLKILGRASPTVIDWNRDGKKDLIVGNDSGYLYYLENKGTDAAPVFTTQEQMKAGGNVIDVFYYCRPTTADWDGDGVEDILCGNYEYSGGVGTAYVVYFHAQGPLRLGVNHLSAASGGKVGMELNAGSALAGRNYLVFASASGTEPGTTLPGGTVLPLNWDILTTQGIILVNTPVFDQFMGTLDGMGTAKAAFDTLAPVPQAAGLYLYFAYALANPFDYASNGAAVEILP